MSQYDQFASYYDAIMGDRSDVISVARKSLQKYAPQAISVLDLGCGTGAVIKGLPGYVFWGVDRSSEMLKVAKTNNSSATFKKASLPSFKLEKQFDAILCLFDTMNHLRTLNEWRRTFERVAHHLKPSGLFLFDMVTTGRLANEVSDGRYEAEIEGGDVTMQAFWSGNNRINLHVAVEVAQADGLIEIYEESLTETAYPLVEVKKLLEQYFTIIECFSSDEEPVNDEASRIYFVVRTKD